MAKNITGHYYHGTVKKLITVFGSIFNDIYYETDKNEIRKVPLFFSTREKFLVHNLENADINKIQTAMPTPRLGFELLSLNYSPERMINPLVRLDGKHGEWQYMRIPYDFTFNLYLATKDFETSLKIIEQIVPLFSPSLNVTVDEIPGFDLKTDIAVTLTSVQPDIDYLGAMDSQRTFLWTLGYTMRAYVYNRTNTTARIKEAITRLSPSKIDQLFMDFTAEIVPRDANKEDQYTVVESNRPREDIFND